MIECNRRFKRPIDWEMVGLWVTLCVLSIIIIWLAGAALFWGWVVYA